MADAKQTPDMVDAAQAGMAVLAAICRDVYAGTLTLRGKGETYLPKFPMEEDEDYQKRIGKAVLFNAFRKTTKALTGMVFRKPIILGDDVPVEIRGREADPENTETKAVAGHAENIDLAGRHIDVFARDLFEDALIDGLSCVLVDAHAVAPGEVKNLDDERKSGVRPYWIIIRAGQILRARGKAVGGRIQLSRFAYTETTSEEFGDFGEKPVTRVRDYTLVVIEGKTSVQCTIWTQTGKDEWSPETVPMAISRIPVVASYTNRTGFFEAEPPLLDLAIENIDHYQTRSDRKSVLDACVPVPVFIGKRSNGEKTLTVGVSHAIEMDEGEVYYLEAEGSSLDHSNTELQNIEQRMAALGLSMLQRQSRAAETAEAKRIDKNENDSQVAAAARSTEDALEECLELHALWLGKSSGGSCEIDKSFITEPIDPQLLSMLIDMVPTKLSLETLWDIMLANGVLPDTFEAETEHEKIEDQAGEGLEAVLQLLKKRLPAAEDDEDDDDDEKEDAA